MLLAVPEREGGNAHGFTGFWTESHGFNYFTFVVK